MAGNEEGPLDPFHNMGAANITLIIAEVRGGNGARRSRCYYIQLVVIWSLSSIE